MPGIRLTCGRREENPRKNVPTVADIAIRLKARAGILCRRAFSARVAPAGAHSHDGRRRARRLPALLLLSDERRLPDPLAALDRLPRGAGVVFRHYGVTERAALARALVRKGRALGIRVLVAGDARLASAVRADGLHLPEARLGAPLGLGPRERRKSMIVTIAAHSLRSVFRAARLGADAAVLGPVFPTASHPGAVPIGPLRFARFCRKSPIPVYAIGGIDPETALRLKDSGAAGIAGIGAIRLPRGRGTRGRGV
ncbi:MAG: thiamine phosphate synthase [Rhodospirillales bacterium]|nr:thiamine phosphate synthase [Rhodospirillales bacterium]